MKLLRIFFLLILLVCIQVLSSQERYRKFPPSPEPLKKLNLPTLESAILSNGLEITVARRENIPFITIQLVILAGESSSPEALPGLATFTANMISKGAANLSSSDIEEEIESIGGKFSTSTFLNYSILTFSFLDEYFDEALDVLSKIILQPRFSKREIENEKRNMFYELRGKMADPEFIAKKQLFRFLFSNHPYQKAAYDENFIRHINQKDILAFYDKYIRPNNAYIILVGNLNLQTASRKVSHYLNTWKRNSLEQPFIPPPEPYREKKICLVDFPQAKDSIIYIGNIIFPRNSQDFFPFIALNQVLGGTTTSRLFMNLRESKGFAYFAFSEVELFKNCGIFIVKTRVRPEVTYSSVKECLKELEKVTREKIASHEIEQAKSYLIGNFPLNIETFESFCFKISEAKVFNLGNDYWNRYYENIMLVNSERVFEVARKYSLLTPVVVIVGDKNKILDHLRNFEKVEVYDKKGELQYIIKKGFEE